MSTSRLGGRSRLLALVSAVGLVVGVATTAATGSAASASAPAPVAPAGSQATGQAAGAADAASPVKGQPARGDKLGQHDRDLLAKAQARKARTVVVLVVTAKGQTGAVASQLRSLGGVVAKRNDKLGYIRATLPTARVLRAAALSGVVAMDLNETIKVEPQPKTTARDVTYPGPGPSTPRSNPYMPTYEIGAEAFKTSHPTWDGRGITIGIMDTGVDLDHPSLQTTSTGQRKIVDWVTATDPVTDGDPTWRAMLTEVTATPTFTVSGITGTWTAPAAGTYRFNRFSESGTAASEFGGDVNRDGDTTDRWGILYRESDNAIWVDTDQDLDFSDEALMKPYRQGYQVGHFGTDNPATAIRERVPFVVEYREDVDLSAFGLPATDFVNIGIVSDSHGSHVAGIAAGNALFGGQMQGSAPGAKLVSSRACAFGGGCSSVALVEGMIDLVVNRGVHVVNMSIGGLPALNDGNNARAALYNRLIDTYGVQIFLSAGNSGPGINTVGDPSVATKAVSVGASISKWTWRGNYGSDSTAIRHMLNFSSRGPAEDGGFKPNITAPGSAISTIPTWLPGAPVAEAGYALPPGYAMYNGTSMSAPMAAGGAALLLSAGRATDTAITPSALRRAVYTNAWFNPLVPAHAQGHGQMYVPWAWALLATERLATQQYTITAPVCTAISGFLATPHRGTGIYNRCAANAGGHAPGQWKGYDVYVKRTTGPAGSQLHRLYWRGNDGSFWSPSSTYLPLNTAVRVRVWARPDAGVKSAALRIDNPATVGLDTEMMATVVGSTALAKPSFTYEKSGVVERNRHHSHFINVPVGTKALQVNLSGIATGSHTRFIAYHPYGVPMESTSSLVCYSNFSNYAQCNPFSRYYANPAPGVWEFTVESRRTTASMNNPYTLRAVAQGITVEPSPVVLNSVTAGVPTPVTWKLTNQFGPVTVTPRGGPLGSAKIARPTIADGATQTYTVEVPTGASRLDVAIGNPSDPGADLDLEVYKGGVLVASDADGDSEESVSIANPSGTYEVHVVGYDVPAGTTAYDYRDVFYAASLGQVSVPATPITLANGQSVNLTGSVTANVAPAAGRELFGEMVLVSEQGAPLGTGTVRIKAVTAP